jgi:hypothetical protein
MEDDDPARIPLVSDDDGYIDDYNCSAVGSYLFFIPNCSTHVVVIMTKFNSYIYQQIMNFHVLNTQLRETTKNNITFQQLIKSYSMLRRRAD